MLGRAANGIFWMFRYLERAENTARLLDAGLRMALTRGAAAASDEWRSVIVTIGQNDDFESRGLEYSAANVTNFILRDKDNPGSILNMIHQARSNARSVRTAITREVWEATNESWMVLKDLLARPVRDNNVGDVLAIIRRQTMLVRGAMDGTMLRNEIYNFARIGAYLECADNTARILDVKYHILLPSVAWVGSSLDNSQWETLLRSVAGERAYRWLNAGALDPRGIAEFLILDARFPRSLAYCYQKVHSNIEELAREHGARPAACDLVETAAHTLQGQDIQKIFEWGLHEFILEFIASNQRIADAISTDYRFVS